MEQERVAKDQGFASTGLEPDNLTAAVINPCLRRLIAASYRCVAATVEVRQFLLAAIAELHPVGLLQSPPSSRWIVGTGQDDKERLWRSP